jgi:hypothetical protein
MTITNFAGILSHTRDISQKAYYCKNVYHWTPGGTASSRRYKEALHTIEPQIFIYDGAIWELGFSYRESCSHVYAKGEYFRNGKKTTLTAVNHLLKKLEAEAEARTEPAALAV